MHPSTDFSRNLLNGNKNYFLIHGQSYKNTDNLAEQACAQLLVA